MAENYVLLETIELSQSAASVTFDNIPQTGYTDLKIVASARISDANEGQVVNVAFNGSTSNISARLIYGTGAAAVSTTSTSNVFWATANTSTANTFGNAEIYIPNYTSSNAKSWWSDSVTENNATTAYGILLAGLWNPGTQAAITTLTFTPGASASFLTNSTFSLYGLAALGTTPVTAPFASGGNIVANDGTYWYHAFLSSGTFTPFKALTCDYLVIAGGASGGAAYEGGGGGAGGLRSTVGTTGGGGSLESPISVTAQNYAITVGAGGSAVVPEQDGNSGSNSTFASITSIGGGYGAAGGGNRAGGNGGSGGGTSRGYAGGTGTAGQGFNGNGGSGETAGGGGGAGGAGGSTAGGAGVSLSAWASPTLTGVSNFYAGGGGGGNSGSGGSGGGGAGHPTQGVSATRNTGSGGGGARTYSPGNSGAGGSGIVIIRYAMV